MNLLVFDKTESIVIINFNLVSKTQLIIRNIDNSRLRISIEYTIGNDVFTSYKPINHNLLNDTFLSKLNPHEMEVYLHGAFAHMLSTMKVDLSPCIILENSFATYLTSNKNWINLRTNSNFKI